MTQLTSYLFANVIRRTSTIFSYFSDDEDRDVYVSVHLSPDSFWKRIWNSIKYIFGYRCMFGHFDEFIFKKQDAGKLQKVVDFLKS